MLNFILILPLVLSLISWWKRNPRLDIWLILLHAVSHLTASVYFIFRPEFYPNYFKPML